jgi:5'-nucleotidase
VSAYDLAHRLVVGIASSALFDLAESDGVFQREGEEAYRRYQRQNLDKPFVPGVAFPFIKRLLSFNDLAEADEGRLVEVIVLSRNDPDTGLRLMRSVAHHGLDITRAVFTQGRSPYRFMPALHMSLFLSANESDVREAVRAGLPAGRVLESAYLADADHDDAGGGDDAAGGDLRIAFDFDGVLADDASERVMQESGLAQFIAHETANLVSAHNPGPLRDLLKEINKIQRREERRRLLQPDYAIRLRVSIVTARSAPAHERAVESLRQWGVTVNDAFFLGGIDKSSVLRILRPHIFFDDQKRHLEPASPQVPSVHVPFGLLNADVDSPDIA